jgi:hypothetical protein
MELLSPILANIILTVVGSLVTVLTAFAVGFVKTKLNTGQFELLQRIAADVVMAVEQSTYGKEILDKANVKKAMAMEMASLFLAKYGIKVSAEELSAVIEAAVASELNANKLIEPPRLIETESPSGFIQ